MHIMHSNRDYVKYYAVVILEIHGKETIEV